MTVRAHFDGKRVLFDQPLELEANTELWVTVLPPEAKAEYERDEQARARTALSNMAQFYKDEPDIYRDDMIIESNPKYRDPWEDNSR